MGQQDILSFLKGRPDEWFTVKDISQHIDVSPSSCIASLNRLKKSDEILYVRAPNRQSVRAPCLYKNKDM